MDKRQIYLGESGDRVNQFTKNRGIHTKIIYILIAFPDINGRRGYLRLVAQSTPRAVKYSAE